jgi:hypothetical protein
MLPRPPASAASTGFGMASQSRSAPAALRAARLFCAALPHPCFDLAATPSAAFVRRSSLLREYAFEEGMPMNSNLTSSLSEPSKGRLATEPSNKPPRHQTVRTLITTARLCLGKLISFAVARALMIFFIGFAAGIAWQSYSGAERKTIAGWSPYLAWVAPAAAPASPSADRFKAMSLALASTRQSLDKLAKEISKAQAQDSDAPRRKTAR